MNRIIAESGLTKGGFYFHFPSKHALAIAVVEENQLRSIERVEREVSGYPRAVDRLLAVPRLLAEQAAPGHGPADLGRLVEELAQDPRVRDDVCRAMRLWIDAVAGHFREAQAEGSVRRELEPAELAEVAVGAFVGMQTLTNQFHDDDLPRRVESVVRVVRLAVLTPEQPSRAGAARRE